MKNKKTARRLLAVMAFCVFGGLTNIMPSGCSGGSSGVVNPAPTGPQGRILFSRDNKLWLINADGTNERRVPNSEGISSADLSPDGNKIVYAATVAGNADIYSINIDGTNRQRLTTDESIDTGPVWSSDGTRIAFLSNRLPKPNGTKHLDILVLNVAAGSITPVTNDYGDESNLDWSPDNLLISFTSNKSNGVTDSLFVVNADGQNERVVQPVSQGGIFAPDSKGVIQSTGTNSNEVVIIDFNRTIKQRLFTMPDLRGINVLELSPDNKMLAFSGIVDGQRNIYIANLDGSDRREMVQNGVFVSWGRQ